jgi:hypothetical protein
MQINRETPPAFRIFRGTSGLWEVVEDGISGALALFKAPQAALSFACDLAATRKGSVVVVFDRLPARVRYAFAAMGPGSASLQ